MISTTCTIGVMQQLVPLLYPYPKLEPSKGRFAYKPITFEFDYTQKPSSKQTKKNPSTITIFSLPLRHILRAKQTKHLLDMNC